jgi:hypothetical protein
MSDINVGDTFAMFTGLDQMVDIASEVIARTGRL